MKNPFKVAEKLANTKFQQFNRSIRIKAKMMFMSGYFYRKFEKKPPLEILPGIFDDGTKPGVCGGSDETTTKKENE
jgi:hypothetical protein